MKKNILSVALLGTVTAATLVSCNNSNNNSGVIFEHQNDSTTIVKVTKPGKYLLLPIQESSAEGKVKLNTGKADDTTMDIRLAVDSIEYYVPFKLPQTDGEKIINIGNVPSNAVCWDSITLSDTFDVKNTDYYRPEYHHTASYGWMNDAI